MMYSKSRLTILLLLSVSLVGIDGSGSREVYGKSRASALSRDRLAAMHPRARVRLKAAIREMRRRGIRPRVNSTLRFSAEQRSIYRCAQSRRCRRRRGIYGARRPGTSLHEAGLAVDLGGVASGRRHRRLTPKGRQMVRIMRQHGFVWRYGLKDPAHFEARPQRVGYRSERAAIKAGQRRWLVRQRRARHRTTRLRSA
jgi:LAS superfamily LD-carboxypeptidase LdcB